MSNDKEKQFQETLKVADMLVYETDQLCQRAEKVCTLLKKTANIMLRMPDAEPEKLTTGAGCQPLNETPFYNDEGITNLVDKMRNRFGYCKIDTYELHKLNHEQLMALLIRAYDMLGKFVGEFHETKPAPHY